MVARIIACLLLLIAMTLPTGSPASAEELPDFRKLWDFSNPAKTETAFRELVPRARASGNAGYLAELLTQLARARGLQGRFEEAHETLDEVERMLAERELPRARVRYLLERGRTFNSGGKKDRARPLFREAWDAARAADEENLAVDAAHMMGIVEPPDSAIEWHHKAMELAEKASDPAAKGWLGPLYNNLGWTYFDKREYRRSHELLQKALEFYSRKGSPKQVFIARWSVAKLQRVLGRVEEALQTQTALREEMEKGSDPDGFVYEELGECLLAQQKDSEARTFFGKAFDLLSKVEWFRKEEPQRLERLKTLGGR